MVPCLTGQLVRKAGKLGKGGRDLKRMHLAGHNRAIKRDRETKSAFELCFTFTKLVLHLLMPANKTSNLPTRSSAIYIYPNLLSTACKHRKGIFPGNWYEYQGNRTLPVILHHTYQLYMTAPFLLSIHRLGPTRTSPWCSLVQWKDRISN